MDAKRDCRVPPGADGHGDDRLLTQGAATSTRGNARVAASRKNGVEKKESIQTITLREANRIQCKATRERSREKERLLREEVELLMLYKAIVDNGPDLFSMHRVDIEARFSFVSDTFFERIGLVPKDLLDQPLASIVDPLDAPSLKAAVTRVLNNTTRGARHEEGHKNKRSTNGTLVNLRMSCGGVSYEASMTLTIGSEGLVVVTRLY